MEIPKFPTTVTSEWASYVEKRRPQFKLHKHRGLAKNAIMYGNRGGVIYHHVDGEWQVYFVFEQNWDCFVCGELIEEGDRVWADRVDHFAARENLRYVHRIPHFRRVNAGSPGPCAEKLKRSQEEAQVLAVEGIFEE